MCRTVKLLGVACLVGVGACSDQAQREPVTLSSGSGSDPGTASSQDAPTRGQIGQVQYGFDPTRLTRAEIQLPVPPSYEQTVWATKLIPTARAEELGEDVCHYGEPAENDICTAEFEDGLAMALLERPIGDYRRALLDDDIAPSELRPDRIAGIDGFSFSAQAEGAGIRYRFFPISERTLLLALRFSNQQDASNPAIRDVLENLSPPGKS